MKTAERKKYFISFLDVLGFSKLDLSKNKNLEKTHTSLERILIDLRDLYLTGEPNKSYAIYDNGNIIRSEIPSPKYTKEILENNIINFSDTIVFYIESSGSIQEDIKKFESICWISNVFISKSILNPENTNLFELPLRCGIAYGDAIIDQQNKINLGQPIIDAYQLSEHQEWMGGAIHRSVSIDFIKPLIDYNKEIFQYTVSIKSKNNDNYNEKSEYALNWVKHHPSLIPWVQDQLRPGPTIIDIGGHVINHNWDNQLIKKGNTIEFIKKIDEEWNKIYEVEKSTKRIFKI